MTPLRQRMLEDLQIRNYAPTTIAAYVRGVAKFAEHFDKPPDQLGAEHVREYQLFLIKQKGVSLPVYIQAVAGLRFFYTHTLNRQIAIEHIPLPRYHRKLPVILSRQEVKAVLEAPKNLGHRTMLATMYAAGPRVSELAHLKVGDIDSARNVIWIRLGKGHKDRQTLLPPKLLELLRSYWRWKRPKDWLFPGSKPGHPICGPSIFRFSQKAAQAAGIMKPFHPHSLRHAFANAQVRFNQELKRARSRLMKPQNVKEASGNRIVLLVNGWTNSAAEMVAGFAAEHRLATIVDTKTTGNVLGAANFNVGSGYWVRLPVFGWYTPKGECLEGKGVSPDELVDVDPYVLNAGTDQQMDKAVEIASALETAPTFDGN